MNLFMVGTWQHAVPIPPFFVCVGMFVCVCTGTCMCVEMCVGARDQLQVTFLVC